jgi:hypothetical protein
MNNETEINQGSEANQTDDQNMDINDTEEGSKVKAKVVPLDTFLEVKNKTKDLKARLKEFEDRDQRIAEQTLIEEKKFQELLGSKDARLKELENQLESERTNNKLEAINNQIANKLTGFNAHDARDALKFINTNELLESESIESDINNRVKNLLESKPYLFKNVTRSETENNQPSNNALSNVTNAGKGIDPVTLSLSQKFKN